MPKKIDAATVNSILLNAGYKLLEEYIDARTPLLAMCDKGHEHKLRLSSFKAGVRCAVCYTNKRPSQKDMEDVFKEHGYTLLENYVNTRRGVLVRCDKGHESKIKMTNFRAGQRCGVCHREKRLTTDFVRSKFAEAGYTLIGEYVNSYTPMEFRCNLGHLSKTRWANFQQGNRCLLCSPKLKLSFDFIENQFKKDGYQLLSKYEDSKALMKVRCPYGHEYMVSWSTFRNGRRCGICHAENFYLTKYKNPVANVTSRIITTLLREIGRQKIAESWRAFYDIKTLEAIATPIASFYQLCPQSYAVDHLVPVSFYNLLRKDELCECWDIQNLRYLPAVENRNRSNKMSLDEISFMRENHPNIFYSASRNPYVLSSFRGRPENAVLSRPYQQLELVL